MYVSPRLGIFNCFVCHTGGNAVNFVMKHEQISYPEALRYLAKKYGINIVEDARSEDLTDEEEPAPFIVRGPNLMTAHPVEATITHQEIAHCLDKSIAKIETSILHVLENTPPELYSDIVENGIFLSGGGALLRGLARRFQDKVNIQFHVSEDPLHAVARGTCDALKHTDRYSFLMR